MTNPFNIVQEQQATLNVWKSSEKRRESQGILYTKKRADGTVAILGTVSSSTDLTYQGETISPSDIAECSVELRLSADDIDILKDEISEFEARLFQVKVKVTGVSLKELTVNGQPSNSIVFFGEFIACQATPATLQGDSFANKESMKDFLAKNRKATSDGRTNARNLMLQAAQAGKPTQQDVAAIADM